MVVMAGGVEMEVGEGGVNCSGRGHLSIMAE